jgi:hypothetical protein
MHRKSLLFPHGGRYRRKQLASAERFSIQLGESWIPAFSCLFLEGRLGSAFAIPVLKFAHRLTSHNSKSRPLTSFVRRDSGSLPSKIIKYDFFGFQQFSAIPVLRRRKNVAACMESCIPNEFCKEEYCGDFRVSYFSGCTSRDGVVFR